jgi:hypothetical protein
MMSTWHRAKRYSCSKVSITKAAACEL